MTITHRKRLAIICGMIIACLIGGYIFLHIVGASNVTIDETKDYPISYVVDGDTFKAMVDGKEITVRMLGIDTPETVDPRKPVQCYGPEASTETKGLLTGHSVRLSLNPDREVKDMYGRYLAYVYRDDGMFVNEYLLENGFAREYTYTKSKPYSFQAEFREKEAGAQKEKKGLWGKCGEGDPKNVYSL